MAKPAPLTVIVGRVYPLPQWNYMSFFHGFLWAIWVYTLRGFIGHHVGEPADRWRSTDTDVSVEAMGMQQTLCPWWNYPTLQNKLDSSTRWTLSSLLGSITGLQWNGRSSSRSIIESSGLRKQDYDLGLYGTSMSGICYSIAKQYWEAWGLFWERSVSLCFLGVILGFVGCSVVVVLCFACLVCLCLMVTPRYLSHLFSHMGELSIETKRIDDRQSFKRVRHRQKKKHRLLIELDFWLSVPLAGSYLWNAHHRFLPDVVGNPPLWRLQWFLSCQVGT